MPSQVQAFDIGHDVRNAGRNLLEEAGIAQLTEVLDRPFHGPLLADPGLRVSRAPRIPWIVLTA
jgi:hypothetical protein